MSQKQMKAKFAIRQSKKEESIRGWLPAKSRSVLYAASLLKAGIIITVPVPRRQLFAKRNSYPSEGKAGLRSCREGRFGEMRELHTHFAVPKRRVPQTLMRTSKANWTGLRQGRGLGGKEPGGTFV